MIDYWITLLLGLSVNLGCTSGYNYCSNKSHTCDKAGLKHFICRKETEFKPLFNTARYVTTLPETMRLRRTILDYFNRFRDELASGELLTNSNKSFKSAARMRALIWDEELAYTARMHASTVSFKHSECRSVSRFPMTGESLGLVGVSSEPRKIEDILNLTLRVMFDEFLAVEDPDRIVDFFDPLSDYSVAHFSCIGNDRLSRVGCGIATATRCSKNKNEEGYCHFFTCHYDYTNIAYSYMYKAGTAASQCDEWKSLPSASYPNLCENTGQIFPLDHGDENKTAS